MAISTNILVKPVSHRDYYYDYENTTENLKTSTRILVKTMSHGYLLYFSSLFWYYSIIMRHGRLVGASLANKRRVAYERPIACTYLGLRLEQPAQ